MQTCREYASKSYNKISIVRRPMILGRSSNTKSSSKTEMEMVKIQSLTSDNFDPIYQDLEFACESLFAIHSIYLVVVESLHKDLQFH